VRLSLLRHGCCAGGSPNRRGRSAVAVTASDGSTLPGVTVEARSDVPARSRAPRSPKPAASFSLQALPPGRLHADLRPVPACRRSRGRADVQFGQTTTVEAKLSVAGRRGNRERHGAGRRSSSTTRRRSRAASRTKRCARLPIGQEYRDLVKLIPGRAVHAGHDARPERRRQRAGQRLPVRRRQRDAAAVSATLSAEPATHDIAQISTVKGGAQAIDFNRSGGFLIDSVSKVGGRTSTSATSATSSRTRDLVSPQLASATATKVRPLARMVRRQLRRPEFAPDRLFFYASYYRPEDKRDNQGETRTAPCPKFDSRRNEGLHQGHVHTPRTRCSSTSASATRIVSTRGDTFASNASATTGTGQRIVAEDRHSKKARGSSTRRAWRTVKYTHFTLRTQGPAGQRVERPRSAPRSARSSTSALSTHKGS